MNLWKLEWLRLTRTRRLLVLLAVFVMFGLIGPLTTKYLPTILNSSTGNSGGIQIIMTRAPSAADGVASYLKNVLQLGVLAAVIVAASALAIDAKKSLSIFYRTRIRRTRDLLLPRFVVVTAATVGAFVVGTLVAWYESAVLLGSVNVQAMLIGSLLTSLYWVFCIAAVAISATIARGLLGTTGLALGIIWLSPILGTIKSVGHWLPSNLSSSLDSLLAKQAVPSDYFRSLAVTVIVILGFLGLALYRLKQREVDS